MRGRSTTADSVMMQKRRGVDIPVVAVAVDRQQQRLLRQQRETLEKGGGAADAASSSQGMKGRKESPMDGMDWQGRSGWLGSC